MGNTPNVIAGAGSNVDSGSTAVADLDVADPLAATDDVDSSATDTPDSEGGDDGSQPEAGAEGAVGDTTKEDGRLIPKWMRAMKEADPEGFKQAKSVLFSLKERENIHPTVQAAREEHDLVQSLGGREGATKLQDDAGFFKEASSQFLKGDPAFVKDLWTEDPIAAALHVSPMLEEFKAKDLAGYKSTIARIWEHDFKALNFAPALKDLRDAIAAKDATTAMQIAQSIQSWHDSIIDESRKGEDPRVKTLLAERNKGHETRQQAEQAEFIKAYRTEASNEIISEGGKTFDSFFRGRKLDKDDRNDLLRESLTIANRAIEADKEFITQRDNHLKRGDSHSALKLTKARYAREMSEAVKRVARRYGLVSGQAKPNQAQPQKPNTNGGQPAAAQGFTVVSARPEAEQIDHRRTTSEMIVNGRAILNDGRKVDWSKLKAKTA